MILVKYIAAFLGMWGLVSQIQAQIMLGSSMYLDFNFYHWYQKPRTAQAPNSSVGQVLNLFPIGGFGIWGGNPSNFLLEFSFGIDYMPFSFNLQHYRGLGALSIPFMLKAIAPFKAAQGLSGFVTIGAGSQYNRTELYARPQQPAGFQNNWFQTFVIEASYGIGVGWSPEHRTTKLISYFFRIGTGREGAWTLNTGLRATMLINAKGHKKTPIKPHDGTYRAML